MRRLWRAAVIVAAGATLGACTLIVGHLHLPTCDQAQCEALNTRDGIAQTACPRWFCSAADGQCHKGNVDADGDGHTDVTCPGGDDCDDRVATIHPGAPETCDGRDDDCNGVIDDSALVGTVAEVAPTGTGPTAGRYSGGVPGRSAATWTAQSSVGPSAATGAPVEGATMESAHPIDPTTNDHDPMASNDSLRDLTLTTATPGDRPTCMVWQFPGDMVPGRGACRSDTDCLRSHGTCVADGGLCSGNSTDPWDPTSTAPFSRNGSCLVPDGSGGATTNDALCERRDVCVRGACVLAPRFDVATAQCELVESALDDATSAVTVVAAIDTQGCAAGALRLFAASPDLTTVSAMGPEYRSNVFTGVDTVPLMASADGGMPSTGARCTGYSRTDGARGAALPSVAGLHGSASPGQALVAYQARDAHAVGACAGMATAPVGLLGLFVESTGTAGAHVDSVTATNDGVPQDLGTTSGVLPVGLASLAGASYAVAYPDAAMANRDRALGGAACGGPRALPARPRPRWRHVGRRGRGGRQ